MTESSPDTGPVYDVGSCPICGDGLRGVRICCGEPVIVCDECDALWSSPAISDRISSTADPVCRHCSRSLWGDQARWASRAEVQAAGWWPQVRQSTGDDLTSTTPRAEDRPPAAGPAAASPIRRPGSVWQGAVFVLLLVGAAVAALAVL